MKHRRTHKRHSKRKTSRRISHRTHRRSTRRRGGLMNTSRCPDHIQDKLRNLMDSLSQQSSNTIEDFYGEVRSLYDEAKDSGATSGCLAKIEAFENGPVKRKLDQLLGA